MNADATYGKRVVFLDRDGVINVDTGYTHKIEDFSFTEGLVEALKGMQDAGFTLVIVTGQSGIARGYYNEAAMHAFNAHVMEQLKQHDIEIPAVAFCPHGSDDGCDCRKRKPGMAKKIEEQIGEIDYENSWTIGDKTSDVMFGKNIGTKTILVASRYWEEDELSDEERPDAIIASMKEAAPLVSSK